MAFDTWDETACRTYTESIRRMVKRDHAMWATRIAARIGTLPATATIAEVACGPGFLLYELAERVGRPHLVAADATAAMLDIAALEGEARGLTVMTIKSPAEKLALADGAMDVVLCKQFLHEAVDVDQCLRELRRILKPGGQAFVIDFDAESSPVAPFLVRTWLRLSAGKDLAGSFWRAYQTGLPGSTLPARLKTAGFPSAEVQRFGMSYLATGLTAP